MKRLSAAIAAAALSGCANREIPLTKNNEDIAKVAILKSVRNPDSVQFGPMVAGHVGSVTTVCGRVNGMNGLGGFTGWQIVSVRIYDDGSEPLVTTDSDNSAFQCAILGVRAPDQTVSADLLKKHHIGDKE
jgi:hypothetical protein